MVQLGRKSSLFPVIARADSTGECNALETTRTRLREAEHQAPGQARITGLHLRMKNVENPSGIQRKVAR